MVDFEGFDRPHPDSFVVKDANGIVVATVHCRDDLQKWSFGHSKLTSDEARRIAAAIDRILQANQQCARYESGPSLLNLDYRRQGGIFATIDAELRYAEFFTARLSIPRLVSTSDFGTVIWGR